MAENYIPYEQIYAQNVADAVRRKSGAAAAKGLAAARPGAGALAYRPAAKGQIGVSAVFTPQYFEELRRRRQAPSNLNLFMAGTGKNPFAAGYSGYAVNPYNRLFGG